MCIRNENSLPARFIDLYKLIRTAAYSIWLFMFIVILCGCLFSGCAGTGDNSSANQSHGIPNGSVANQPQTVQDGLAQAQLTILWPSQSPAQADNEHIKLIPSDSDAITITISNPNTSQTITSQTVDSPGYGKTSTVIFPDLPVGTFTVTASAYPDASGTGVAQATGTATLTTAAGQTSVLPITMKSTIDHLIITSTTNTIPVGGTSTLTVTAYDATDEPVIVGNTYQWESSNSTASVNPDGVLTGNSAVITGDSPGLATISVEETESVKTGTTLINVEPAAIMVTPNPVMLNIIGATAQLSVSSTDENGNTIQLPVSDFTFTSAAPSIATVDPNGIVKRVSDGGTIVTATYIYSSLTGTTTIPPSLVGTWQLVSAYGVPVGGYLAPIDPPTYQLVSGTATFNADNTYEMAIYIYWPNSVGIYTLSNVLSMEFPGYNDYSYSEYSSAATIPYYSQSACAGISASTIYYNADMGWVSCTLLPPGYLYNLVLYMGSANGYITEQNYVSLQPDGLSFVSGILGPAVWQKVQ